MNIKKIISWHHFLFLNAWTHSVNSVWIQEKKSPKVLWMRGKLFLKVGMFLIKLLDSNGLVVNRNEKGGIILWMMATKSLIIMMFPTKPLDSNMLGKPCPISTIIGNIILKYNSWLLALIFHLLMVNVKLLILRTIFLIHIINIFLWWTFAILPKKQGPMTWSKVFFEIF